METKHKNIDQLDGNTSMDSEILYEYCEAKGTKENMIGEEDDDDDQLFMYFCNHNCQLKHTWKQWTLNTQNSTPITEHWAHKYTTL